MSFWDSLFKGKASENVRDEYGTWNPEQKTLGQNLGNRLTALINSAPELYSGQFTAPLSKNEQNTIDQQVNLGKTANQRFLDLMSGNFPEDYYQSSIYQPLLKQYQQDIQPAIEEQYAGSGGYWGGARADAVASGYGDLADTLVAKRAELSKQARELPLQVAPVATEFNQGTMQLAQIPRLIQQYGLDQQYKDWTRGQEQKKAYIDQALKFLDISTVTNTFNPGRPSLFQQVAGTGMLGVGGAVASDAMSKYPEYQATARGTQANMNMLMAMLGGGGGTSTTSGVVNQIPELDYSSSGYVPQSQGGLTEYQNQALSGMNNMGNFKRLGALAL